MSFLWYPSPKEKPIASLLGMGGGIGNNLIGRKAEPVWIDTGTEKSATYSGSGNTDGAAGWWGLNGWVYSPGSYTLSGIAIAWIAYYTDGSKTDDPWAPTGGSQVDPTATHFYDFSTSYNDQVGSINFNTNTGSMALGSSSGSYGNPPGWSGGYGYFANAATGNGDFMHTTTLPDMSGDFCIDVCSYNTHDPSSSVNMIWSLGSNSNSPWVWYIYNVNGTVNADSANATFTGRLGEVQNCTSNYVQNKWCVSRYRRSGNTASVRWFEEI